MYNEFGLGILVGIGACIIFLLGVGIFVWTLLSKDEERIQAYKREQRIKEIKKEMGVIEYD